jgi:hypothetical protein
VVERASCLLREKTVLYGITAEEILCEEKHLQEKKSLLRKKHKIRKGIPLAEKRTRNCQIKESPIKEKEAHDHLSSFWDPRNLSYHMDRKTRTSDTVSVKSREMTCRRQTLPWWLGGEG